MPDGTPLVRRGFDISLEVHGDIGKSSHVLVTLQALYHGCTYIYVKKTESLPLFLLVRNLGNFNRFPIHEFFISENVHCLLVRISYRRFPIDVFSLTFHER